MNCRYKNKYNMPHFTDYQNDADLWQYVSIFKKSNKQLKNPIHD